jgi:large subunit ribosomal protein L4
MILNIIDNKGQSAGQVDFDSEILPKKGSKAVLHEYVVAFRANKHVGTHKVKTRTEVSGGGIKPWKQKHTGRARSGSIRSPLWRHGGIVFGPTPRDYSQDLPRKKKQLAFRLAVKELLEDNRLQVVEPIQISEAKTRVVAAVYKKWQAPSDSLFVVDKIQPEFGRASRNIENVRVADVASFNAYEALQARRVYITKPALDLLIKRLGAASE